jgi:O-antigen/teichoic acid export membrane protein
MGMALVSEPMIQVLIGEKWLPCVPYLRVLCLVGVFWPLQALNISILISTGRSGLSLKLAIIKRVALVVAIVLTYRHGIVALLWGQVGCSVFSFVVNTWPNRKFIHYPIEQQLFLMAPYLAAAAIMGGSTWGVLTLLNSSALVTLLVAVLVGVAVYIACLKAMRVPGNRQIADLFSGYRFFGPVARFILG